MFSFRQVFPIHFVIPRLEWQIANNFPSYWGRTWMKRMAWRWNQLVVSATRDTSINDYILPDPTTCDNFPSGTPHINEPGYRLSKKIVGSDTLEATEEFIFESLLSCFWTNGDNRDKQSRRTQVRVLPTLICLWICLSSPMTQLIYHNQDP